MELIANLGEKSLDGGESPTQSTGLDFKAEFGAFKGAGFGLEDVAGEVGDILYLKSDTLAFIRDGAAGFDLARGVAAVVANSAHDNDVFEVGDVDFLDVDGAVFGAAGAQGGIS